MDPEELINAPMPIENLIGDAGRIARGLMRKVERIRDQKRRLLVILAGAPGCGKSAVAQIIARALVTDPVNLEVISGTKVDTETVGDWMLAMRTGNLIGGWSVKVVEEIDQMPLRAQTRMLDMIDQLPPQFGVIGTSNAEAEDLTERFSTRFQFLAVDSPSAVEIEAFLWRFWGSDTLANIAQKELQSIAQNANGNVRVALHELQTIIDLAE